jgi:hypothetical protein
MANKEMTKSIRNTQQGDDKKYMNAKQEKIKEYQKCTIRKW